MEYEYTQNTPMFYANQLNASTEVVYHFAEGRHHVILSAYMQSGKTGTFHHVIRTMLANRKVKHVVLFCGMSDTKLCRQAHQDCERYNSDFEEMIDIVYLQDLMTDSKKERILSLLRRRDMLIVTDECDRDSKRGSLYHQLLNTAHVPVNGDVSILAERNLYILNVSATPFAEHVDTVQGHSFPKPLVRLVAGDGYIGIRQFYEHGDQGNIHEIFPIRFETREEVARAIRMREHKSFASLVSTGNKYNIVRYHTRSYDFELFERIAHEHGVALYVIRSNYSSHPAQLQYRLDDLNALLGVAPTRPSLILIHGTYRAGFVLEHKQHIGFVWENSESIKVDTCVQGLPGRVCGYNSHLGIHIYVSPKLLARQTDAESPPRVRRYVYHPYFNEIERFIAFHEGEDIVYNYVKKFRFSKAKNRATKHYATPARKLPERIVCEFGLLEDRWSHSDTRKRRVLGAVLTDLDNAQEWRTGASLTIGQREELEERFGLNGLLGEDRTSMDERIENHLGDITLRHATNEQHEGIIRGIQLSHRRGHPVRNNQGILSGEREDGISTRSIVVFGIEPDYRGVQDEHSQDTRQRTWYYFIRTHSISRDEMVDTDAHEMYRYGLSDTEYRLSSDGSDGSDGSDARSDSRSIGSIGSIGSDMSCGVVCDIVPEQIMRTRRQLMKYLVDMTRDYLGNRVRVGSLGRVVGLRITRTLKQNSRDLKKVKDKVARHFGVEITIEYARGRYRQMDDTREMRITILA